MGMYIYDMYIYIITLYRWIPPYYGNNHTSYRRLVTTPTGDSNINPLPLSYSDISLFNGSNSTTSNSTNNLNDNDYDNNNLDVINNNKSLSSLEKWCYNINAFAKHEVLIIML